MKPPIYIETSVVSYLTARPTRDVLLAARRQLTIEWWENRRAAFELYASLLVVDEAAQGDDDAAKRRLAALEGIPLLDLNEEVQRLAGDLVHRRFLPAEAADDAVHAAAAAVHGMSFLLTWNCRHLANAEIRESVADFLRIEGYNPPVICTPEELMGGEYA